MRKINPKCSDIDSFKNSILISLHYYHFSFHSERISKLKPYEDKYNFSNATPIEFETNNPIISLTIFQEDKKKIYTIKINNDTKAKLIHLKDNRYAALKPLQDKITKLKKILKSFSNKELKEYILNHINSNNTNNNSFII